MTSNAFKLSTLLQSNQTRIPRSHFPDNVKNSGFTMMDSGDILPTISNGGTLAYNSTTSKLYVNSGISWLELGIVDNDPIPITGVQSAYTLATNGTPTIITAQSTDPEGFPLTWSYAVTSGTLGDTATITQLDNVFTINPSSVEAHAGTFSVTFSVTDGTNITTQVADFALAFYGTQIGSDTIYTTGSGTYSIPSNANYVKVFVTGGGAGGGGATAYVGVWFSTGGGGAGGTAIGSKAVSGGGSISYTVGTNGTGGIGQANGTNGLASSVSYNGTNFAIGWGGVKSSGSTGGGPGSATSNGMVSTSLLTGGSGQNGQAQYGFNGGDGGASYYGPGGSGGNAPSANGGTTSSFGGGGGGAGTNTGTRNGGAGTRGKIVIQAWTALPP